MITVGENTKLAVARQVGLKQARAYLVKQLTSPSPNIATIYSNVKAYVDADATLTQMIANKWAVSKLANGWLLEIVAILTNSDKAKYLDVVISVVGILPE